MKENMLVDKRVHHIVYGEGLVISQTPRKDSNSFYLEVKFGEIVKKFIFPDALHKYLEFVDSEDIALFFNQEMNLSNTKEQKGDKDSTVQLSVVNKLDKRVKESSGSYKAVSHSSKINYFDNSKSIDNKTSKVDSYLGSDFEDAVSPIGSPTWFRTMSALSKHQDHFIYTENLRKRFLEKYAPEKIANMDGKELLRDVFGSRNSMLFALTGKDSEYGHLGSCGAYKYLWIVYCTEDGLWTYKSGARKRQISVDEAMVRASEVRDSIVRAANIISKKQLPDRLSDYRLLEEQLSGIFFYTYGWFLKYLQMVFPEWFPCMYADNTLHRALEILGLPDHGNERYLNLGEIALFTRKCGIKNINLTDVYGTMWGWDDTCSPCAYAKNNWTESKYSVSEYKNRFSDST